MRLGPGRKSKHMEVQTLWVQQLVNQKIVSMFKIDTVSNPADVVTKHVPRGVMDRLTAIVGYRFPNSMNVKHEPFDVAKTNYGKAKEKYWNESYETDEMENDGEIEEFTDKSSLLANALLRRRVSE